MIKEESAGIILFYIKEKEPIFLLLKYPNYWGFSKGIIEKNETPLEAAKRELEEETNIKNFNLIPSFKYEQEWFYRRDKNIIHKKAIFFLAETTEEEAQKIKISSEHEDFSWISYNDATKKIKLKNNQEMLKKAYEFIREYKKQKKLTV